MHTHMHAHSCTRTRMRAHTFTHTKSTYMRQTSRAFKMEFLKTHTVNADLKNVSILTSADGMVHQQRTQDQSLQLETHTSKELHHHRVPGVNGKWEETGPDGSVTRLHCERMYIHFI